MSCHVDLLREREIIKLLFELIDEAARTHHVEWSIGGGVACVLDAECKRFKLNGG